MDYRSLDQLRKTNPAWRLLAADNAPMIVSFLYKTFIQPNVRTMSQQELVSRLADYLYGLHEKLGDPAFPRRPGEYLDDWASDSHGWLRKYYPPGNDEAHYDLTPATERKDAERALYDDLRQNRLGNRLRLEQERIPYGWIERALVSL